MLTSIKWHCIFIQSYVVFGTLSHSLWPLLQRRRLKFWKDLVIFKLHKKSIGWADLNPRLLAPHLVFFSSHPVGTPFYELKILSMFALSIEPMTPTGRCVYKCLLINKSYFFKISKLLSLFRLEDWAELLISRHSCTASIWNMKI